LLDNPKTIERLGLLSQPLFESRKRKKCIKRFYLT
jgi:hypothetical protein